MTKDTLEQVAEDTPDFLERIWNGFTDALPTILLALLVFAAGLVLVRVAEKIVGGGMKRANVDDTASGFLVQLIRVGLYTLTVVIVLSVLNVPMTSIVAVIGAAGLAIGLALQNSLSNLAGGFIILFAKPFRAGDFIETSNASGTVECVSILYTKIITIDNKTVYIPNGMVSSAKIINYNEKSTRRLDLEFSIGYGDDFQAAKAILRKLIMEHPLSLQDPAPAVYMSKQDASAIVLLARVWVKSEDYWALHFDLLEQAKQAFDAAGISIPFQQLDVHLDRV